MFSKLSPPVSVNTVATGVATCVVALASVLLIKAMSSDDAPFEHHVIMNGSFDSFSSYGEEQERLDEDSDMTFRFCF